MHGGMSKRLLECCVDSVASAIQAEIGGAGRLELCAGLVDGGTTPSLGMMKTVKAKVHIPVFALIRPRAGDFCYDEDEVQVMLGDIQAAKAAGLDGVVIGALNKNGSVDVQVLQSMINEANPMSITFHRAIDVCSNWREAIDTLKIMRVNRVLTSGMAPSAMEGALCLKDMVERAKDDIIIMAGGGVTESNAREIALISGCLELHGSMRETVPGRTEFKPISPIFMGGEKLNTGESEFVLKIVSAERVRNVCNSLQ